MHLIKSLDFAQENVQHFGSLPWEMVIVTLKATRSAERIDVAVMINMTAVGVETVLCRLAAIVSIAGISLMTWRCTTETVVGDPLEGVLTP